MNAGFAGRRREVESALLEYQRAPGQYQLLLRRPEILFASIREVLQLASGRLPDGATPPVSAVQRAAGFFIRSALLHPAADHYALLGLERSASASAIKERYRQMMRLMHPDFASAAAGGSWPADAASRINQAYEVLASDVQRRSYDAQLNLAATPAAHRPAMTRSVANFKAAAGSAPAQDRRRLLKRIASAFGALAAVALVASLLALGSDRESLVQRATPPPAAPNSTLARSDAGLATAALPVEAIPAAEAAPPARGTPASAPAGVALAPARQMSFAPRATPRARDLRPASLQGVQPRAPAPVPARVVVVASEAAIETPHTPVAPTSSMPSLAPAPAALPAASPAALPAPPARTVPDVTLAEAHALLSTLLQQLETGSADRLLSGLDPNARRAAAAQALAREYEGLTDGARSVKVSSVQLRAEAREERLVVRGQVLLEISEYAATRTRELALEAEFAKRNGVVVMTGLGRAQGIAAASR